jgi:hypothetical protein
MALIVSGPPWNASIPAPVPGDGNGAATLGFDFYLDGVDGDDSGAGTTPGAAFRTVAPINAMGTHAGLRIGVRRGTSYRQQLTLTGAAVYVGAYGDGPLPLFDASDLIPDGWTATAGRTNVWQRGITLPGTAGHLGNAWNGNTFLVQVASIAACESTPGSFFVTSWTTANSTIHINSATDPNGGAWSYSARSFGLTINGNSAVVEDIRTRRNAHQGGSITLYGNDCIARRLRIEDGARHAMYAYAGLVAEDCYFFRGRNDLEAPGSANSLVVNEPIVAGKRYRTVRCTFDGGDTPLYTGPQNHGADANELFEQIDHIDPVFINVVQGLDVASARTNVTGPRLENVGTLGLVVSDPPTQGEVQQIADKLDELINALRR